MRTFRLGCHLRGGRVVVWAGWAAGVAAWGGVAQLRECGNALKRHAVGFKEAYRIRAITMKNRRND